MYDIDQKVDMISKWPSPVTSNRGVVPVLIGDSHHRQKECECHDEWMASHTLYSQWHNWTLLEQSASGMLAPCLCCLLVRTFARHMPSLRCSSLSSSHSLPFSLPCRHCWFMSYSLAAAFWRLSIMGLACFNGKWIAKSTLVKVPLIGLKSTCVFFSL